MRQSLNGRANRCANNARTFERAGSTVIGAPRYFVNESALTSWFRKSEPRAHENPNLWNMKIRIVNTRKSEFWCKGVRFVCTVLVRSNLTPLHQGLDFLRHH